MAHVLIVEDNHELASLIASAVRTRGHQPTAVHTGQAAREALGGQGFAAAVVDLLLPDVRGSEVLGELRLRAVPAVAISGVYKGDRFAREATQVHGAVAFFEKPFDMQQLLEAIDRLTGKPAASTELEVDELDALEELTPIEEDDGEQSFILPRPAPAVLLSPTPLPPRPTAAPEPEATDDDQPVLEPEPHEHEDAGVEPPVAESGAADGDTAEAFDSGAITRAQPDAEAAAMLEAEAVAAERVRAESDAAALVEAALFEAAAVAPAEPKVDLPLPFPTREATAPAATAKAKGPAQPAGWRDAGVLASGSVPRLLTACFQGRFSGELKLRQGTVVKVVSFEDGRPIHAASNLAPERFARFCARKGVLPESELMAVHALGKEQGIKTAEAMIRLDLITADQRRVLLEEQVRDILWSTFGWTEGDFQFTAKRPNRAELVPLSLFPGTVILEGVAKTETLLSLRQKMARTRRMFPTADPPYALHELALTDGQALLLAHADGSKTVEDLLSLSDLTEKDALGALVGFEMLSLVIERRDESKHRRISFGI